MRANAALIQTAHFHHTRRPPFKRWKYWIFLPALPQYYRKRVTDVVRTLNVILVNADLIRTFQQANHYEAYYNDKHLTESSNTLLLIFVAHHPMFLKSSNQSESPAPTYSITCSSSRVGTWSLFHLRYTVDLAKEMVYGYIK